MKKIVFTVFATLLVIGFANAATVSVSTSTPAVDGADIANLGARTGGTLIWTDRPMLGQTFTTGANAGGYTLNSVSFIMVDPDASPGPANLIEGWKDWRVRVGTIVAGQEVPMIDTAPRFLPDATDDNYFTITFDTPLSLVANTVYGFSLGVAGSQESWSNGIPSLSTTGDDYAGGSLYSVAGGNANALANMSTQNISLSTGSDTIFHLDMAAAPIPEPSVLGLAGLSALLMFRRRRA